MTLIDRYVAKAIVVSIGFVTLMLAGLEFFILFVNQLGDLGKVHYGIVQAMVYVLLQLPYQVYLFFPMASLLGCLIGLGMMASHCELVVMRAAGVSIWQVTLAVLKTALMLILLVTVLGETLVPKLARMANEKKTQAMNNGQTLRTSKGMWLRSEKDYIVISSVQMNTLLQRVYQFRFDESHHLRLIRYMESIAYVDGAWQASQVHETSFADHSTQARQIPSMRWDVSLKPTLFGVGTNESDEMTLPELRRYLRAQTGTNSLVLNAQLDYWQRIFQPLTTVVMMVLAIPFVFGPLRSSTMGSKLLVGATVGFGFHILNSFFGPFSQVYQWPPIIAAVGPTCVFALLGAYLMYRVK